MVIQNEKYNITGMGCAACSARIENTFKGRDGVKSVSVNLLNNNMLISYDDAILNKDEIINLVKNAGYGASLASSGEKKTNF